MTLSPLGKNTSKIEINLNKNGIWLLVNEEEFFLPYPEYPWFLNATLEKIYNVELQSPRHLFWPDLDIDLSIDSLKNPDNYPLISH
ncbi:MAG: DUF2442 domain-containing protein [Gammaproteobacteria bacterium]